MNTPPASNTKNTGDAALDEQLHRAAQAFRLRFASDPTYAVTAPGRVNLIGEHTDYSQGFVLPMAIERQTVLVAAKRDDDQVVLASTALPDEAHFSLRQPIIPGEPAWSNYLRGVLAGCIAKGLMVSGFNAVLDSTVPVGGGLSSSASIEVAAATLAEALAGQTLDPVEKALLCQKAEHDFAGVPCGIMDQFITTMAQAGAAMLIDCRSYQVRMASLNDPSLAVLIINSNVKHELTDGGYAARRNQCEAAAKALGVKALRDVALIDLEDKRDDLDNIVYRRARHVISENARTLAAADALARGDWRAMGRLMIESHQSLRDDFEVSCRELDLLVELTMQYGADDAVGGAEGVGGVIGSRMTGGGFGGCTVSLVRAQAVEALGEQVAREYQKRTGIEPTAFVTRPAAGARAIM